MNANGHYLAYEQEYKGKRADRQIKEGLLYSATASLFRYKNIFPYGDRQTFYCYIHIIGRCLTGLGRVTEIEYLVVAEATGKVKQMKQSPNGQVSAKAKW